VTEDQKYAILDVSAGTSGNELYWKDLAGKQSDFRLLVPGFDHDSEVIDNLGDKFLVRTNIGAPNFRLVLIDPRDPARESWKEICRKSLRFWSRPARPEDTSLLPTSRMPEPGSISIGRPVS